MKISEAIRRPVAPSLIRLKAILDKAPADEVYTVGEMTTKFDVQHWTLTDAFRKFTEYRIEWGYNRTLWGNPKAIAALLKRKDAK